jgi:hypothetical protein
MFVMISGSQLETTSRMTVAASSFFCLFAETHPTKQQREMLWILRPQVPKKPATTARTIASRQQPQWPPVVLLSRVHKLYMVEVLLVVLAFWWETISSCSYSNYSFKSSCHLAYLHLLLPTCEYNDS